jgi:hypothetical protein
MERLQLGHKGPSGRGTLPFGLRDEMKNSRCNRTAVFCKLCRSVLPVLLKIIHRHRLGEALILFGAWLGRCLDRAL